MAKVGLHGQGGGAGPFKLLDASSSTDASEPVVFPAPMSNFGFQVLAASADAVAVLEGSVASSSDATLTTLVTFNRSSDGSGDTLFATGMPVSQVSATITAGASSGGLTAWVSATP